MGNIYEYVASGILLVEYWYLYSSRWIKQTTKVYIKHVHTAQCVD